MRRSGLRTFAHRPGPMVPDGTDLRRSPDAMVPGTSAAGTLAARPEFADEEIGAAEMDRSIHEARWLLMPVFILGVMVGVFGFVAG